MRLGIFGGSFDPVHYGHLLLAECCREQCRLDQVWFVPAAIPPHKQQHPLTPAKQRIEMLELAVGGQASFAVCRLEVDRGGVSYTVDTLESLHEDDPSRELFLLLGADALTDLPTWNDPQRICRLATLAVARRPGQTDLAVAPLRTALGNAAETLRLVEVDLPQVGLSSSDLRRRAATGASIRFRTPRSVEQYIATAGLYRT